MKVKVMLILILAVSITGCGATKFIAGGLLQATVHQTGHYLGAKATGVDIKWVDGHNSIPGFQPNEHMTSDKPEPLAYGGGLLLTALLSEVVMWRLDEEDSKGNKFMTDVYLGYLFMASYDEMSYGLARSGLLNNGEGKNDFNKRKFGGHHKAAGLASALHGASLAYRLQKHKRIRYWFKRIKIYFGINKVDLTYVF